ncbi:MAG TPA: hypothetical protein VLD19_19310, partial [Chitinophagaceae bacterium]|nr:hypothetical protein [Chitinophagaceae bacterium]
VEKIGGELLFSIKKEEGSYEYLDYPEFSFLKTTYRAVTQWGKGRKVYYSDQSYFAGAKVLEVGSKQYVDGKTGIRIKTSDIFEAVERIAQLCEKRRYFEKAGIFLMV